MNWPVNNTVDLRLVWTRSLLVQSFGEGTDCNYMSASYWSCLACVLSLVKWWVLNCFYVYPVIMCHYVCPLADTCICFLLHS